MNKITVIGAGSVGSTVAYTLAVTGIASEIVMIDINREKALGARASPSALPAPYMRETTAMPQARIS